MKIDHSYFPAAAQSFIDYLDTIFKPFEDELGQKFPIFIPNTGDEAFLTNKYSIDKDRKKTETLYRLKPNMMLDVKGFTIDSSQLTNRNVLGAITGTNEDGFSEKFVAPVRRIPLSWVFNCEVKFNNIVEFFHFIEVFLTTSHHNHYFTFYYAGTEYNCTFFLQEDLESQANMLLQFDTDKRTRILPLTFVLSVQFPAFDIYPRGLHGDAVIPAGQTMTKLIHNLDVTNCFSGVTDHIQTITTENGTTLTREPDGQ